MCKTACLILIILEPWLQGVRMKVAADQIKLCFMWAKISRSNRKLFKLFFYHGAAAPPPSGPRPHYRGFKMTLRHTTLGRTPLDLSSARIRDLYVTKHNSQHTDIYAPAGFEPTVPASERPQSHALDRVTTGIGQSLTYGMWEWRWKFKYIVAHTVCLGIKSLCWGKSSVVTHVSS